MRAVSASWVAVAVLLGGDACQSGCGRLREKEALRRFARQAVVVEGKATALEAGMARVASRVAARDLPGIRAEMRRAVLPAARVWVRAARGLPETSTAGLGALRGRYVREAEGWLEALEAFSEGVREDLLDAQWTQLQARWDALLAARRRFRSVVDARLRRRDMRVRWPTLLSPSRPPARDAAERPRPGSRPPEGPGLK